MKTSTNLKMMLPEGKDPVNIDDITGNFETLDALLANMQTTTSDASQNTVVFAQASDRQNIASTEKLSIIMGKIAKFFSDIKAAAFCSVANNDTTTADNCVADARIVKVHGDEIDSLNTKLNQNTSNLEQKISSLSSKASSHDSSISSLNSNLANSNNRIGSLESANNSRYTENGRINVYVGGDSKLHFVNRDGADTALNFSSFKASKIEGIIWGCLRDGTSPIDGQMSQNGYWTGNTIYGTGVDTNGPRTSPDGSMFVCEGKITIQKAGRYIWGITGYGIHEGDLAVGHVIKFGYDTGIGVWGNGCLGYWCMKIATS